MAMDEEVLAALEQAVKEAGQSKGVQNALAAWLNGLSDSELTLEDNLRRLDAVKHSIVLSECSQ